MSKIYDAELMVLAAVNCGIKLRHEIAEHIGINRETVRQVLDRLVRAGRVERWRYKATWYYAPAKKVAT